MTSIPAAAPDSTQVSPGRLTRPVLVIGTIFYITGTMSFIGIVTAFFTLRLYAFSNDSRIAFIILFAGLFFAFQGLIFILVARGGETQREQTDYLLKQVSALYSHSAAPGSPPPSAGG